MKEVFEKIIGKLEELRINSINEDCPVIPNSEDCEAEYSCSSCFLCKAIEIVKQEAEKYNYGWIPCSKEKPKEKGEYSVSYPDGTVSIQYWDGNLFSEINTVSGKSIIGQPVAWKQKDEPYRPCTDTDCACYSGNDCPASEGCGVYHQKEKPKIQTNADRIRAMTDEELANFMSEVKGDGIYCNEGQEYPIIPEAWKYWLQSEVEE